MLYSKIDAMKNLMTLFLALFTLAAFAQGNASKNDIIFTKDGELIQAKVVKVTSDTVSFTYPGESVVNEVRKGTLEKIVFSSGRTQNFGTGTGTAAKKGESVFVPAEEPKPLPREEISLYPSYNENTIAIVPASFTKNGNYSKELSSTLSKFTTSYLAGTTAEHGVAVQDMTQTIRSLVDKGIGYQELKNASIGELRNALGAEYLVKVSVEESKNETTKKGFYGDEEIISSNGAKTTMQLTIYGANPDEEIHSSVLTYEKLVAKATDAGNGWQSLAEYLLSQFIAAKN